jgi:hypothetical protein
MANDGFDFLHDLTLGQWRFYGANLVTGIVHLPGTSSSRASA